MADKNNTLLPKGTFLPIFLGSLIFPRYTTLPLFIINHTYVNYQS